MVSSGLIDRSLAARSLRLWIATRLAVSLILALGGNNPLALSKWTVAAIVVLTALLVTLEMRKHREHTILSSMGISPAKIYALVWVPPVIGEVTLILITSVFPKTNL